MLGNIGTSDTSQTGPRCPCTPQIAFYPRIGRVFFLLSPNSKVLITCLLLVAQVWDVKPAYSKS